MPILVSFELLTAKMQPHDHNRIQSMFERLGWQNLGGSAYRYPALGTGTPAEDWLNHVIPAMMLFRAFCRKRNCLKNLTIDCQSSTGFDSATSFGHNAEHSSSAAYKWHRPKNGQFAAKTLKAWVDAIDFPY